MDKNGKHQVLQTVAKVKKEKRDKESFEEGRGRIYRTCISFFLIVLSGVYLDN